MFTATLAPPFVLDDVPDTPAVFLIETGGGSPYLARTARLRRRLHRLLGSSANPSRLLNLQSIATAVRYRLTPSRLASQFHHYEAARLFHPDDYISLLRLRFPPYLKVLLANPYPRTQITTRLSSSQALHYGPFRTRAAAERFEAELLNLFQVRRCQEDLTPSPDHPGCIYGEMGRCLRPCQEIVSPDEYRTEVLRLTHFLETSGESLLAPARAARERYSAELDFEAAQRQHLRIQTIGQVLRLHDELSTDALRLSGLAVTPSPHPGHVELRFLLHAAWLPPIDFRIAADASGAMIPLDRRLRELASALTPPRLPLRERAEHLALLARWFYSSWRDGEWISFSSLDQLPYRSLVRAISRIAASTQQTLF